MSDLEVAERDEEVARDPGVPVDEPGPYSGAEPDPLTGGFGWWNDPLYPGNDVQPNEEWVEARDERNRRLRGEIEQEPVDTDANDDV